jgi:glucose-6-phosphate 1-dehydrogenase
MNVDFTNALSVEKLPYEQLLGDALDGNSTRFATQPIIEGTWRALAPILDKPGPAHSYAIGTMGPKEADRLTEGLHPWIQPVSPASDQPA